MAHKPHSDADLSSALDLIIGDTPGDSSPMALPVQKQRKEGERAGVRSVGKEPVVRRDIAAAPPRTGRPRSRTGRPPGVVNHRKRPKDKTALSIDLELMDRYRKQSWKEECQLGELVERALRAYAQETWNWHVE
jgi:hypothetical protein